MKSNSIIMGMPVEVCIAQKANKEDIDEVFAYLRSIDEQFSTYKKTSEVTKINSKALEKNDYSKEMKKVLKIGEKTKKETDGYFDVWNNGRLDPSGIVKGYAIKAASEILKKKGYKNFFVEIAGDMQISGLNENRKWKVGIKNPLNSSEILKVLKVSGKGIATSGTYARGNHIYNPKNEILQREIVSLTVIARNVLEADRMATGAFAMGRGAIPFLEKLKGFEAFAITKDNKGIATKGFRKYVINS